MHFFVAKLLSFALMTYTYNPTSITSETYVQRSGYFVMHTANKLQHAIAARALTRDHTVI